jgi:hypothetical protein
MDKNLSLEKREETGYNTRAPVLRMKSVVEKGNSKFEKSLRPKVKPGPLLFDTRSFFKPMKHDPL